MKIKQEHKIKCRFRLTAKTVETPETKFNLKNIGDVLNNLHSNSMERRNGTNSKTNRFQICPELTSRMVDLLPLTLSGDNLGRRHQCLNSTINEAYKQNVPLQTILNQPEAKPIDRIFKIDLASKHKDVDFIVKNLKEKDMLFVSRALKCRWLMETKYSHIFNPQYLEDQLYPCMTTTAVNKTKNFIELNLKDPKRCQDFFEYYKSNFDVAIKFLWHCSKEFIKKHVLDVVDKLTPKHLRMLCEACPLVAKIYFEGLQYNKPALLNYLRNKNKYHRSIMNVLKTDPNVFLDLLEKYFDQCSRNQLSPSATKYIMKNHKNRYLIKPELYAGYFLNVNALAPFLSSEEINDIIIRLARANYLSYTLTYKHAEPLILRLNVEERTKIKNIVFIDKSFGDKIKDWPYPPPKGLEISETDSDESFDDIQHEPYEYEHCEYIDDYATDFCYKKKLKKRSCAWKGENIMIQSNKSSLSALFDRYRFMNFDRVFFEFRKLLLKESTIEGRRNMFLVLVSKAGANEVKLEQLLKFLVERHSNEPENVRDAVARSMVKRAFAWRLSSQTWTLLQKWATSSVREILHTKILRHLLRIDDDQSSRDEIKAYLNDFSDLTEYSLTEKEKSCVRLRLPQLLVENNEPSKLLDVQQAYKLRVANIPRAEDMLVTAARKDEDLLRRIYELRIARRLLFRESFSIGQNDPAYVNALKHDISVLNNGESFADLLSRQKCKHDRFLRALVLYFSEPNGLATSHHKSIEKVINEEPRLSFARPMAFLSNAGYPSFNEYLAKMDIKSSEASHKAFAAAVRANASVARPTLDIDALDWRLIGAKFICNKVLVCSESEVDKYIHKGLQWKKTMRAGLRLARRNNSLTEVLPTVLKVRPSVALHVFLTDLRKGTVDIDLWNHVKHLILNLDFSRKALQYVKRHLTDPEQEVLSGIRADYWVHVFKAVRKTSELQAMPMLCCIENLLNEVDDFSANEIILEFISGKLNKDLINKNKVQRLIACLYFRIIAKYLMMSQSSNDQDIKIKTVCDPFFDQLEIVWNELDDKSQGNDCLMDFVSALKYSKAFFDPKYENTIPMFERILERLPKLLPRERHFNEYVRIHLTMLYYRSIQQALKQRPELIKNPKKIQKEGLQIVGLFFGKYIGIEIKVLVKNYFKSIIEIYKEGLLDFFNTFVYNDYLNWLVTSTIKGLIDEQGDSLLLAQMLYSKERCFERDHILKLLKSSNNKEMKFFLYADINPY